MMQEHCVNQRQACKAVKLAPSTLRYRPRFRDDTQIITELQQLIEAHPAIGFWQCYYRIRRKGLPWNHKRIYRVYTELKLNVRRRYRRRLPARDNNPLAQPDAINETWT